MRPTVVHLIAGAGLGTALIVSLALPGRVVIAGQGSVQGLALPRSAPRVVVEAAPLVRPADRPHVETRPRVAPARVSYALRSQPRRRARPQRAQVVHRAAPASRPAASPKQTLETLAVSPAAPTESESKEAKKAKKAKEKRNKPSWKNEQKGKAKPGKVRAKEKKDDAEREDDDTDDDGGGKKSNERDGKPGHGHGKSRDD